jgi:Holliday junction resolvase RusA-like endonuclease
MTQQATHFDVDAFTMGDTEDLSTHTFYLEVQGPAMVQQRTRIRFLPLAGRAVVYDPSQASKRAFRRAVLLALNELGIVEFPVFQDQQHLKIQLNCTFYLHNEAKDVDNLLKFVMDALESVIYQNDRVVFETHLKKVKVPQQEEFTKIEVRDIGLLES